MATALYERNKGYPHIMNTESWYQDNTEHFDNELGKNVDYNEYKKPKQKHKSNSARRKIEMLQDQKELRNEITDYFAEY